MSAQRSTHEMTAQMPKYAVSKLATSKEQILHEYPDVLEGLVASHDLLIIYRSKCYPQANPLPPSSCLP